METIRWGIISTANIGRKAVAPAIQKSSNGTLHAVASRSLEDAEAYAAEFDMPAVYGSYEEMLEDPDIDAIYNPLPNHLHAEWSIRCAEAGIPVLCEKPLASDAAEAREMVDAFAERGVPLAEAFMYRFHPRTEQVRELVQQDAIGEVQLVRASFSFVIRSEENIRLRADMAGGALMDVGCYCVNVMRYMLGEEPETVAASAVFGEASGVDEWLTGTLAFPSGARGMLDCSLRSFPRQTYELRGPLGRITVAQNAFTPGPDEAAAILLETDDGIEEILTTPVDQYQLMVEDFADAVLNDRPPLFPPEDAVRNMHVIDAMLAAARRAEQAPTG